MPAPPKLSADHVSARLRDLPGWTIKGGKLHREFTFSDFVAAFGFMTEVAQAAEALEHHPEWFNVWNRVTVDLNTHDAGGLTELDFSLAARMSELAAAPPHRRLPDLPAAP
ncbi:MAG TPA: 4a-hydroxytetrahydrobiopterin dehydratase [Methylomirabilota bacterium]|nr:4a-hydroxytetrahydrobiopterin dehydratase [Methylomirabilota bacterium]